jgi:hypothetical protein
MRLPAATAAVVASLVLATVAGAASSRVFLSISPSVVHRGNPVLIRGSAGSCPVGDTVFLISSAFARVHEFAGVPAVLAKVQTGGRFRVTTRIPPHHRVGRYVVTARCGGGNLGVAVRLIVRR